MPGTADRSGTARLRSADGAARRTATAGANRALLAVAYDTLLRRSELAALQVSDLALETTGAATVLVRNGKTDAGGRGEVLYLARDSVAMVAEWLERSGVGDGRLFRSLRRGKLGEALDPSQIPRIYKVSTAAGICTGAAAQKCTTGSVVACPRSPWEGPARGATRPPRGWRRPARERGVLAHAGKRGVIRTVAGVVTGSA